MTELIYKVQFHSEWHCGSGLSSGADVDTLVIRDKNGLPFIPGKTLKGLLRDAAEAICKIHGEEPGDNQFIRTVFGWQSDKKSDQSDAGICFFSNAGLSGESGRILAEKDKLSLIFRQRSATAIDTDGQAKDYSLRRIETVVPLTLFAKITGLPEEHRKNMKRCLKWIKRLGVNRNRGLGRCTLSEVEQ